MKASEMFVAEPFLKLLVYGDSGTGKTTWGARTPRPFVLVTERQAIPSIAVAAPDAEVVLVRNYSDLESVMDALSKGAPTTTEDGQPAFSVRGSQSEYVIQTLVLDSLSDMHSKIAEHCRVHEDERKSLKRWGDAQQMLTSLLQRLRSLPLNVVALALSETVGGGDGDPRRTVPSLHGKMAEKVGQYFSGVALAHKRPGGYALTFNAGAGFVTKRPPTRETGIPDLLLQDLHEPGMTTLGSLLLALHPGVVVPHLPSDSSAFVLEQQA